MNKDRDHIQLLSIFHYVIGVLIALTSSVFIIHVLMGVGMGTFMLVVPEAAENGPPAFLGFLLALIPLGVVLSGWITAACIIYAGMCLKTFRRYTFCMVMACILCLFAPFGTALGVFTIIILLSPSVKELFLVGQDQPSGR